MWSRAKTDGYKPQALFRTGSVIVRKSDTPLCKMVAEMAPTS